MQNGSPELHTHTHTSSPVERRPSLAGSETSTDDPQITRHSTANDRSRWVLHLQAQFWRVLMSIGMALHRLAPPQPPPPSFSRSILTPDGSSIELFFYVPDDYGVQRRLRRKRYPAVVNFHGGGFTLGHPTDDARWAQACTGRVGAVCVSVGYRLAPERVFPGAVEDGACAVRWCVENAEEFLLDPNRFALSGFSSGANMCFTVAYRLQQENILISETQTPADRETDLTPQATARSSPSSASESSISPSVSRTRRISAALRPRSGFKDKANVAVAERHEFRLSALVSFYPPCDYTQSRAERRKHCIRPDQSLPATFTSLFDESYLQPASLDLANPLLSPGLAPEEWVKELPRDIVLVTCEWDMLLQEGERFRDRLRGLGKKVTGKIVEGVPHAWDKGPNPLKAPKGAWNVYLDVTGELRRTLRGRHAGGPEEMQIM